MTSALRRSEIELAQLACAPISERKGARVLIGGLGLGFTLRAALDALRPDAQVVVAELNSVVVRWCRGPLVVLTGNSLGDPRVSVLERDVTKVVRDVAEQPKEPRFDAIIWDLYRGPGGSPPSTEDRLYGATSIQRTQRALSAGGVFAIWGERRHAPFETRLTQHGFRLDHTDSTGKGPRHAVYMAIKQQLSAAATVGALARSARSTHAKGSAVGAFAWEASASTRVFRARNPTAESRLPEWRGVGTPTRRTARARAQRIGERSVRAHPLASASALPCQPEACAGGRKRGLRANSDSIEPFTGAPVERCV